MYILKCSDDTYYVGSTVDLERRLLEHQRGEGANYTRRRLPVELVYCEEYSRIDHAFYREKQVQGWSRKKREALINNQPGGLPPLSTCQNSTHSANYNVQTSQPIAKTFSNKGKEAESKAPRSKADPTKPGG